MAVYCDCDLLDFFCTEQNIISHGGVLWLQLAWFFAQNKKNYPWQCIVTATCLIFLIKILLSKQIRTSRAILLPWNDCCLQRRWLIIHEKEDDYLHQLLPTPYVTCTPGSTVALRLLLSVTKNSWVTLAPTTELWCVLFMWLIMHYTCYAVQY